MTSKIIEIMPEQTQLQSQDQSQHLNEINLEEALNAAVEGMDEIEEKHTYKFHQWTVETITVKELLKRYKEEKFHLPLCQRLYVWDAKKRNSLMDSIRCNLPCGTITLVELEGALYLIDGLQRTVSLMLLSNDHDEIGLTSGEKKMILDYKIALTIVKDIDTATMKKYFSVLNSGVAVAAAVRERSKLSEELNNAILTLSGNPFFRQTDTTTTFNKSHHHELIAMNALLAATGIEQGENSAKKLCEVIAAYESDILKNQQRAQEIIGRVVDIFKDMDAQIIKRSLNANFVCTLVYVLANETCTNEQIQKMISYIFQGKRAVSEYSATTSKGAGHVGNCKRRYELLVSLLKKTPQIFNEKAFKQWCASQQVVKDSKHIYLVDFEEFTKEEQKCLYSAHLKNDMQTWDKIIEKTYKALECKGA